MAGFLLGVLGALAALALFRFLARRRWSGGSRRWALRRLFARLGTTPEQERAVLEELDALRAEARSLRREWEGLRGDLAALLAGEPAGAERAEAVLSSRDEALAGARRRLAQAVARLQSALDGRQRAELADLVRRGGRCRARGHAAA